MIKHCALCGLPDKKTTISVRDKPDVPKKYTDVIHIKPHSQTKEVLVDGFVYMVSYAVGEMDNLGDSFVLFKEEQEALIFATNKANQKYDHVSIMPVAVLKFS